MKPHDHPLSSSSSSASSVLKRPRQLSHYLFSLLAFIVFVTILYSEDFMCIFSQQLKLGPDSDRVISGTDLALGIEKESEKIPDAIGKTEEGMEKEKEKEIPFAIVKTEEKEKEKEKEKISNAIPKSEEWREEEEKEKIPSATEKTHEERIEKKKEEKEKKEKIPFAIGKAKESCDIFSGRWVWDEYSRPLYQESDCPYIQPQLTCLKHGRPDRNYQHWRWQPHGCDLPKFNAKMMLETLRGKRMMFVGDSLNRGQFQSMVCLLQSVIPEHAKSMENIDSSIVFKAKEYNATIEFYWAPFLLESNTDNAIVHRFSDRIVRKGSINKHGKHWKGADIIVFNTYLWWMTGYKMNISRRPLNDKVKDIIELSTDDAYRMAMKSMLRWAQINMNPKKTRVFFTSMSPLHDKSIGWGGKPGGNCYNETSIIEDPNYWGFDRKSIMQVLGQVFSKSKYPVTFLNITQLSNYRKDAHTSIYKKQWNPLTPEQIANPVSYADCVHWCLPGLQDTWNELLFAKLFYP